MNQRLFFSLLLAAGLALPAYAACGKQSQCCAQTKISTCSAAATSLPQALSALSYVQGKPDTKAKYYIYLHSASWCGACCAMMPTIAQAYEEMKEAGVEIIMFGHDKTASQVRKYVKSYGAKFPALLNSTCSTSKLSNYRSVSGIPHIFVFDQNGKELLSDHPKVLFEDDAWKDYVKQWESSGSSCSGSSCSGSSCSGSDICTVNSVSDMDKLLTSMVGNLEESKMFESDTCRPGQYVWKSLVGIDNVKCYGIARSGDNYVIIASYFDVTRMLYKFNNDKAKDASACMAQISSREAKALNTLKNRLEEIITDGMTAAQKVQAIHDDLVDRTTYSCSGDSSSVTGIILNNTGICNGYSLYMYLALNMVGVPCHRVVGNNGFCHVWNLVQIDGKWYHLDATWDGPRCCTGQPVLLHTYFCVSDETMAKDHEWDRTIYPASAEKDLDISDCSSYCSESECASALQQASCSGCTTLEGRAAYATDQEAFVETLSSLTDSSGKKLGVESYHLNGETGRFIVNFGNSDSNESPKALELQEKPLESAESVSEWNNVESPELNKAAEKALQEYLAPGSTSDSWEELMKKSQDLLKNR